MCGLSGAFGDVTKQEEDVFKDLLVFSQIRGVDSTGIGSVSRNIMNGSREMKIAKDVGPPYFLFDTKAFDRCFYGTNQVYIGHNRSKTVGEASRKNAHPFLFDDILGAHNGTISYQDKNRLERGADFKTDSEAIFNNIQVHGIQDTISRIDKTEAYALTWYDKRDNTMNFLRNDQRPLWYIPSLDNKVIFWASEYEILMAGVLRRGYKTQPKAILLPVDTHFAWKLPTTFFDPIAEPVKTKMENRRVPVILYDNWKKKGTEKSSNTTFASMYGPEYDETELDVFETGYEGVASNIPDTSSFTEQVKQSMDLLRQQEVKESKVQNMSVPATMSPLDFTKKRKFEELRLFGQVDKETEKMPIIHKSKDLVVHRDSTTGKWTTFRWDVEKFDWEKHITMMPPPDMPFTIVDINSRHAFHHQGRKKNKKIFYKGFKGKLLNQETFNIHMQPGCLSCSRKPEWGNEVVFINPEHQYLCEFCAKTPNLIEDLKGSLKKVG